MFYPHLNYTLDTGALSVIVGAASAGLTLAAAASAAVRTVRADLVGRLLAAEAATPESARSLGELGVRFPRLARRMLRDGSRLRRTVLLVGDGEKAPEPQGLRRLFSTGPRRLLPKEDARFYLPEENRLHAETRFLPKPRNPVLAVIAAAVLFALAAVLLRLCIPQILSLADAFAASAS